MTEQQFQATVFVFCFVPLLWGCNVHSFAPDKDGAAMHIAKGKDFSDKEQFSDAVAEFKAAVDCDPSNADAHALLSDALADNEDRNQALIELETAIKLAPNDAAKLDRHVALLEDLGKYEQAVPSIEKLLVLRPKDPTLRRQASWLYEQIGDNAKSLQLVRDAVKLDPHVEKSWTDLVSVLQELGKPTEALQACRQGIKMVPDSNSLYYELGLILSSSKRPSDAIAPLKKAIALDPDDEDARVLLERLSRAAGKPLYLIKLEKVGMSFFANVVINEKVRAKLVVDSGATSVVISNDVAKRAGVNLAAAPEISFGSASGEATGREVHLNSIRVGDAKLSDVKAIVHDIPSQNGEAGLLGMSFLSNYKVTLDADHSELWLVSKEK